MKNSSIKQIGYGTIFSYIAIIFNTLSGFIYTPWMISKIGDNNYALYSMVISLINFFLMDFGLSTAVQRYVAKYAAENRVEEIQDLLGIVFKLYLAIMACVVVILAGVYFSIDRLYTNLDPESLKVFKNLFLIFAAYCVINFPFTPLNGILNGLEQFKITKLCDLLSRILIVILMVLCLYKGGNVYSLVIVNAGVGLLFVAIKLILLITRLHIKVNFLYQSREMTLKVLNFSLWVTVYGIANRLAVTVTPQVLGLFSNTKQVTIYSLASMIEGNAYSLITVLGALFLPEVSRILSRENYKDHLQALTIKIGRVQGFIGYLAVVGFVAIGNSFVLAWMGQGYEAIYMCTLLILLPNVIIDTQTIASTALDADNKVKYRALLCVGQAVVSIGMSSLLAPTFGAIGACIGLFCSYILKLIGLNILYMKIFKLNIFDFFKCTVGSMIVPIGISLAAGFAMEMILPGGWLWVAVKALLIVAIYILLFWLISANYDEKLLIRKVLKHS